MLRRRIADVGAMGPRERATHLANAASAACPFLGATGINPGNKLSRTQHNSDQLETPYAESARRNQIAPAGGRAVAGSNPVSPTRTACKSRSSSEQCNGFAGFNWGARGPISLIEREPVYGATTSLAGACSHPVRIAQVRSRSNLIGTEGHPRWLRSAWPVTATLVGFAPATAIGGALVEHAGWEWCFVAAALTARMASPSCCATAAR